MFANCVCNVFAKYFIYIVFHNVSVVELCYIYITFFYVNTHRYKEDVFSF